MWYDGAVLLAKTPILRWSLNFAANLPVIIAILFLLAGVYFGANRHFWPLLLSIPVLSLLALAAVVSAVWATFKKADRTQMLAAWVMICLAPLGYLYAYKPIQQIRFLLWAPTHYSQLAAASKKNGIVKGWDSWGMAGSDTFSYLVVDTEDRLGSKGRADTWTKQIGQTCGFWDEQRVWTKWYIVTTYTNCPYDGVEPAN